MAFLGTLVRSDATSKRLAILVALAFLATAVTSLAHPTPTLAWSEGTFSSSAERELIALTNHSRAAAGRKALKVSATLTSIARWRSKDMSKRDYFSHSIPGYGNVFKKISSSGFCYHLAGENIGWISGSDGSATTSIHQMFMDSSGHRSNILGKAWDVIGIGAYKGADGKHMYTVLFADKCGSSKATTKPKAKPKPKPRTTVKPKPKATVKPKPRATPKPTPTPTPEPTPSLAPVIGPDDLNPSVEPTAPPPDVGDEPPSAAATSGQGLRIDDPAGPSSLVDSVVGDVTELFLGR
jgi:uncharacterized protein YkwD